MGLREKTIKKVKPRKYKKKDIQPLDFKFHVPCCYHNNYIRKGVEISMLILSRDKYKILVQRLGILDNRNGIFLGI